MIFKRKNKAKLTPLTGGDGAGNDSATLADGIAMNDSMWERAA